MRSRKATSRARGAARRTSGRSHSAPVRYRLSKLWHPSWYQGGRKRRGYFEGWELKERLRFVDGQFLTPTMSFEVP